MVSICEDKVFATFLPARENYRNLLGCHRQNWEVNAVELVKTAPRTRLSQTWKSDTWNFSHSVGNEFSETLNSIIWIIHQMSLMNDSKRFLGRVNQLSALSRYLLLRFYLQYYYSVDLPCDSYL